MLAERGGFASDGAEVIVGSCFKGNLFWINHNGSRHGSMGFTPIWNPRDNVVESTYISSGLILTVNSWSSSLLLSLLTLRGSLPLSGAWFRRHSEDVDGSSSCPALGVQ